ncbi:MAG: hypothetical protein ABJB61_15155 [bacterium]
MPRFDDDGPPPPFAWIEKIAGEKRQAVVLRLICRGLDRVSIHAYAHANGWKEERGDLDHYIEVANEELSKAAGEIDTEIELGKAHKRLDFLYMKAVEGKGFKVALDIQKEINKILTLKVAARTKTAPVPQPKTRLKIVGGQKSAPTRAKRSV